MTSAARTSDTRRGFTLFEIVMALAIVTLLMGGAVTLMVFRTDERKLRSAASELELLAKQARTTAILRQAPYAIEFRPGAAQLVPMAGAGMAAAMGMDAAPSAPPTQPSEIVATGGKSLQLDSDMKMFVRRWNTRDWLPMSDKITQIWRFDPDGLSEPLSVRFEIGANHMETTFHPLTATVFDTVLYVK